MTRQLVRLVLIGLVAACRADTGPTGELSLGTWGGDNAAAIVSDTLHVHIGCTYGNAARPSLTAGRFEVPGQFNITAYPVDRGVFHPARFIGRVSGSDLTLTVVLTDTTVTLGPVVVRLNREPSLGQCPICRPRSVTGAGAAARTR